MIIATVSACEFGTIPGTAFSRLDISYSFSTPSTGLMPAIAVLPLPNWATSISAVQADELIRPLIKETVRADLAALTGLQRTDVFVVGL